MKRDKEWLKKAIENAHYEYDDNYFCQERVNELIDELEEPEISENQAWEIIAEYYPENVTQLKNGFERWFYNEDTKVSKPVSPRFVADFIESYRNNSLHSALESAYEGFEDLQVYDWMGYGEREETFARAWLDGYSVEKEKLYTVEDGGILLLCKVKRSFKRDWEVMSYGKAYKIGYNSFKRELTEKEIKDYDERYWAFAEEVTHE